ncbi:homoserine dehydrogenase, partial [Pseudochrobactrum sp. sp1633]|nr:homoserine dehydrogenase [Pseudochrobactrum sp. sp1633]
MTTNVALTGLARDMKARADTGRPIRIGLIGSGEMGTDIVTRVAHMPGIEIGAISELRVPNALKAVDIAFQESGHGREANTASELTAAMEAHKVAVTDNANLILENDLIDVVIDATGVPAVG